MAKISIKLLFYFFGLFVILTGLYFLSGLITKNHRLGTSCVKQDRLKSLHGSKAVIIGGSNLHYGLNSQMLEDSLGIPVVNMGLQASIGLQYMFREIIDQIDAGDLVILQAEPALFLWMDVDGEKTLYTLLSKYPVGIQYLTAGQVLKGIAHIGPVVKENFEYLPALMALKFAGKPTILENTNSWGDYEGHKNKASIFKPPVFAKTTPYEVLPAVLDLLHDWKSRIEAKEAKFWIGFSPLARSVADEEMLKLLKDRLSEGFSPILLGSPSALVFPDSFFFDTHHHLVYDKRDFRTAILIKQIHAKNTAR